MSDPGIKVLLVDDSAHFLEAEKRFLAMRPELTVIGSATSGEAAISETTQLHPDLILMDLTMPGMNGLQATSQIKKQPNAPRIIIVTLHDQHAYRTMSETAGADGFITKDSFGEPLFEMIRALFGHAGAPQL